MKTMTLLAQKGGTGKTTLSIHLAVQAGLHGCRVLLVDVDPQGSATAWWRRRDVSEPGVVQCDPADLADTLGTAEQRRFDLVIVDSAPHSTEGSRLCARLCDQVYIPTRPAVLDLDAISATTSLVREVDANAAIVLNACPPPGRRGEARIVAEAREALAGYGLPVCESAVSQRAAFSHALIDGRAVSEFDPRGKAAREIEQLWQHVNQELGL